MRNEHCLSPQYKSRMICMKRQLSKNGRLVHPLPVAGRAALFRGPGPGS